MKLNKWVLSHLLTGTRTIGQIGFNKNGDFVDIWIRVNGKSKWFGVNRKDLMGFLSSNDKSYIMNAESDGNDE